MVSRKTVNCKMHQFAYFKIFQHNFSLRILVNCCHVDSLDLLCLLLSSVSILIIRKQNSFLVAIYKHFTITEANCC